MKRFNPSPQSLFAGSALTGLTGFGTGPGLSELDERARDIFRRVVETYLETGEPVGSRTVSRGGVALSPASIRNTMQDLTELGLLAAPHTSAGRLPTHAGLRLFVDGLMEVGDISDSDKDNIESRLAGRGMSFEDALNEASQLLSGLAGGAGVVVTPVRDAGVKHVEFVALSPDQALAVMVFDDGTVENRKYILQQANFLKHLRLYLRVTDANESQTLKVLQLCVPFLSLGYLTKRQFREKKGQKNKIYLPLSNFWESTLTRE